MCIYKRLSAWLLLSSMVVFVTLSFAVQAAALRVLVVIDTDDSGIGAAVDADHIKELAKEIEDNTELALYITVVNIEGEFVATSRRTGQGNQLVKQAVENFTVEKGDVVIFYYSGHGMGGNDPKWPGLAVEGRYTQPNQLLEMAWVRDKLWEQHPKLLFVIADACNNIVSIPTPRRKRLPPSPTAYKELFLEYSGYLMASSSKRGEYSIGGPGGGAFTNRFLRELGEELVDTQPRWENIASRMDDKPIKVDEENEQHPQLDVSQLQQKIGSSESFSRDQSIKIEPETSSPVQHTESEKPVIELTCADGPKAYYYRKDGKDCCLIKNGNGEMFCK